MNKTHFPLWALAHRFWAKAHKSRCIKCPHPKGMGQLEMHVIAQYKRESTRVRRNLDAMKI